MKKHIQSFVLAGVCGAAALVPLSGRAQPDTYSGYQERGFYLQASPGVAVTRDTTLKEFFGPVAPGSKVEFDTGARLRVGGGYQFNDWFALEAETGVIANRIRNITGASRVEDASLSNVPLLMNVRFQGPKESWVSPYIGAGAGYAVSVLDADHIDIGGTSFHGNMSDAVFAYQAFAGLRFRLNHRMGLSLAYHYFATTGPDWEADFTSGTPSDHVRFGGAETHSVSAVFDFSF